MSGIIEEDEGETYKPANSKASTRPRANHKGPIQATK